MSQFVLLKIKVVLIWLLMSIGVVISGAKTAWATNSYIYGIDDSNDIWQVNPEPGEQTFVDGYNTNLANQSNAFTFDRDRDQMFFLNRDPGAPAPSENNLWMWNKPLGTFVQIATGTQLSINGLTIPANAAYYANAFWFFKEGTFDLVKATLVSASATPGTA